MNLNKHIEFFDPTNIDCAIHIIGCGAIGSRITELLVRLGCTKIHLWDFDTVSPHNITNQLYTSEDIGKPKVDCLAAYAKKINPLVELILHGKYSKQNVSGFVFLCVDSIDLRREIATHLKENKYVKAMFDARMRSTDAQSYGADWSEKSSKEAFINTMQFSSEEAKEATPVSACGTTLSVAPTVWTVASVTVSNFINFTLGKEIKSIILLDAFEYNINAF
jgi:molybdopterin/thiamine biosynthesis adenylyltransferase